MTWPDAVPFDPAMGTASAAIEALLEGPGSAGPVVLLAVGPAAQQSGWAAQCAMALADGFAARGESVLLADLSLHRPELHELLGVENEEGLSDVFLFGASLQHIMRAIPGKAFRLIPASQFTPDAYDIVTHARWGSVFEELAADQSKLLVYMPVDVSGAPEYSDRVGHTIVLAEDDEVEDVHARLSADAEVIGVLVPPPATSAVAEVVPEPEPRIEPPVEPEPLASPASTSTRSSDAEFEKIRIPKDSAREALIADLRSRQRAALMAPPPQMAPLPTEEAVAASRGRAPQRADGSPPPIFRIPAAYPDQKKPRRWFSWVLVLVLLLSIAAGVWYYRDYATQWISRGGAQARREVSAPPSAPPRLRETTETVGTALPYSVAIASYQVLNLAQERITELSKAEEDTPFFIGPIVVQGTLFYRVMAGPVTDSAAAAALRDTLIQKRIKTISLAGDIVSAPYAFLLGEYASRGEADARRADAMTKGIPSYIVDVRTTDGALHHKVYAGAYTGPGDAEFMRPMLEAAGFPANLVERTGST